MNLHPGFRFVCFLLFNKNISFYKRKKNIYWVIILLVVSFKKNYLDTVLLFCKTWIIFTEWLWPPECGGQWLLSTLCPFPLAGSSHARYRFANSQVCTEVLLLHLMPRHLLLSEMDNSVRWFFWPIHSLLVWIEHIWKFFLILASY
jgi:hypothetical protein